MAPGGTLGTELTGPASLGLDGQVLDGTPGREEDLRSRTPLRVALGGEDHAGSYVFLASDRARGITGTVVHSDRGSQFRSHAFVRAIRDASLHGSMGRVGACADNAAMESFFSLLQKNVLNRRLWKTREDLRLAIITWIEKTYLRRRRQDRLGRLTPIEYETLLQAAHAA